MSIIGFVFAVMGTLFKISHWEFGFFSPNLILGISVGFSLLSTFVVLVDILKNPLKNKFLWLMPLFFVGNLVAIIYLINRETHLRKTIR